ncbi:MAG: hypothetical protein GX154_02280 [Clostridiales bacterium]|nr:hypothetical protein [Clostridiales bacterium]
MPLSVGYERYFIILNEEEKGYEIIGGKLPTGYVNVERRGNKVKIKGLIQNIRVGTKSDYRLYLAAPKDREYIEIGRFRMDKEKGEVFSELDLTKNMVTCRYTAALVIAGESIVLYGGKEQEKADILDWFYQKYMKKDEVVEEKVSLEETKTDRLIEKEVPKVTEEVIQERIVTEETLEEVKEEIEERAEPEIEERAELEIEITDLAQAETDRLTIDETLDEEVEETFEEVREEAAERAEPETEYRAEPEMEVEETDIEERAESETDVIEPEIEEITDIDDDETDRAIEEELPKETEKEMQDQNIEDEEEQSKEEIKEKEEVEEVEEEKKEEEEFFTGEGSRQFEDLPYIHRFHQIEDIDDAREFQIEEIEDESYFHEEKAFIDRYPEITGLIKKLRKTDGIEGMGNYSWFEVDNKLHLFNDITVDINGTKMPLSYPYFIKGCGPWINDGLLGVEYERGLVKKLFIGLPGVFISHWEPYFKSKGFAKHGRDVKHGKGYWIMCIDLDKRDIQN